MIICVYYAIFLIFTGYICPVICYSFPVKISVNGIGNQCPQMPLNLNSNAICDVISDTVVPQLDEHYGPAGCDCGDNGCIKVVSIDMTKSSQQCPASWNLYNSNRIRGCGRGSTTMHTCYSALFVVNKNYSRICGKIMAYQRGDADDFLNSINGRNSIEGSYMDGVSVTYGAPGSCRHIWTFVSGDRPEGVTLISH